MQNAPYTSNEATLRDIASRDPSTQCYALRSAPARYGAPVQSKNSLLDGKGAQTINPTAVHVTELNSASHLDTHTGYEFVVKNRIDCTTGNHNSHIDTKFLGNAVASTSEMPERMVTRSKEYCNTGLRSSTLTSTDSKAKKGSLVPIPTSSTAKSNDDVGASECVPKDSSQTRKYAKVRVDASSFRNVHSG